jgi:hypothetical protein
LHLVCLIVVGLSGWLSLLARSSMSKDAELLVLRHEVPVSANEPEARLDGADRALFAALCRLRLRPVQRHRLSRPARSWSGIAV